MLLLLGLPFLAALLLRLCGTPGIIAWLLSCCVVPAWALFAEYVLPYSGGGASFLPIGLVVGGFYGAVAGGLGVLTAAALRLWYR